MRYQKLLYVPTGEWVWVRPVTATEASDTTRFYMDYQTNVRAPAEDKYEVLGVNKDVEHVRLLDEFIDDPQLISLVEWEQGKHD